MVPVGLAGLATRTPLSGLRRCSASSASGVIAQRVSAEVWISTGSQPSAVQDVPVWRIAGIGERDAIAGLEHRQEREDESARRSGGYDDPRRIDREAVLLGIVPRNARRSEGMPSASV